MIIDDFDGQEMDELLKHPAVRAYHRKKAAKMGRVMTPKKQAHLDRIAKEKLAGPPMGNKNRIKNFTKVGKKWVRNATA